MQSNALVQAYGLNVSFFFGVSSVKKGVKCRPVKPSSFCKRGVIQNSTLNAFASLARDLASNITSIVEFDFVLVEEKKEEEEKEETYSFVFDENVTPDVPSEHHRL